MPRAESSDAYLDRVMALAASQARNGRANHAAAANHGGVDPADQTSVAPANHGRANTIDQTRVVPANHGRANTIDQTSVAPANHGGANTIDQTRVVPASHARVAIQPHTAAAPEASRQIDQFGPLPWALRPFSSSEREVDRDHRASSSGGSRAVILRWLPGILLAAGLAWALTNAPAQPQPAKPKPAAAAPAKNAPAKAPKQQQQPAMPVSTEQALYLILRRCRRSMTPIAPAITCCATSPRPISRRATPPPTCRRFFPTCGGAISTSTPRRCGRHSSRLPALDQRGYLHLIGFFPTRPQQIDFDLLFQNVANQWRLFGISVSTPEAPSASR
jgi:hypothetical protein